MVSTPQFPSTPREAVIKLEDVLKRPPAIQRKRRYNLDESRDEQPSDSQDDPYSFFSSICSNRSCGSPSPEPALAPPPLQINRLVFESHPVSAGWLSLPPRPVRLFETSNETEYRGFHDDEANPVRPGLLDASLGRGNDSEYMSTKSTSRKGGCLRTI